MVPSLSAPGEVLGLGVVLMGDCVVGGEYLGGFGQ